MSVGVFRNHPCVCGSGRKFKHCCWGKKANEIRYNHIHVKDNPEALCLTCREQTQELAVKSAMPSEKPVEEQITAEL